MASAKFSFHLAGLLVNCDGGAYFRLAHGSDFDLRRLAYTPIGSRTSGAPEDGIRPAAPPDGWRGSPPTRTYMAGSDAEALAERVEKLRALLARNADDATAWFGLGPFHRAIALDADYTAAHRDLGRALLESGAPREAVEVLQGALELAQRTGDLQTGRETEVFLRRARRALGEEPAAARRAAPAPSQPPAPAQTPARAEARAVYKRGFQHFVDERYDEAIALYREALELDPALCIAWNDDAIRAGERLVELDAQDPLSHTNLSILYMRKGMIAEAEAERAIALQLQMRAQRGE
jgi:tetratricopeptide (TPR) repeat protein